MKYINQLEYKHIPYPTRFDIEGATTDTTISSSGCGLCSVAMIIDMLTTQNLSLEEAVEISHGCRANRERGTNMSIFGPVIAEKFGLDYSNTSDLDEAIEHLRRGGQIVVHVVTHEDGTLGLFTKGGHYMTLVSTDGKEFCILDPSAKPDKFQIPEREGKVNDKNYPYLYCDVNIVHEEAHKTKPKYHLFSRKKEI